MVKLVGLNWNFRQFVNMVISRNSHAGYFKYHRITIKMLWGFHRCHVGRFFLFFFWDKLMVKLLIFLDISWEKNSIIRFLDFIFSWIWGKNSYSWNLGTSEFRWHRWFLLVLDGHGYRGSCGTWPCVTKKTVFSVNLEMWKTLTWPGKTYTKRWKDPAFYSWVNPLFRLGHFQ